MSGARLEPGCCINHHRNNGLERIRMKMHMSQLNRIDDLDHDDNTACLTVDLDLPVARSMAHNLTMVTGVSA